MSWWEIDAACRGAGQRDCQDGRSRTVPKNGICGIELNFSFENLFYEPADENLQSPHSSHERSEQARNGPIIQEQVRRPVYLTFRERKTFSEFYSTNQRARIPPSIRSPHRSPNRPPMFRPDSPVASSLPFPTPPPAQFKHGEQQQEQ